MLLPLDVTILWQKTKFVYKLKNITKTEFSITHFNNYNLFAQNGSLSIPIFNFFVYLRRILLTDSINISAVSIDGRHSTKLWKIILRRCPRSAADADSETSS